MNGRGLERTAAVFPDVSVPVTRRRLCSGPNTVPEPCPNTVPEPGTGTVLGESL